MTQGSLSSFLAQRALEFNDADIPADVLWRARHSLFDWFGVTLAGRDDADVLRLEDELRDGGSGGQCSVFGSPYRFSAYQAALLNGAASHSLDFDDTHLPSRVHPSVPLWPAILACGERYRLGGREMLGAFVAGVEVQSRLARVMGESHYRKGWHNTATLGAFGATAAVGRLRGLTTEQLNTAFGLVASDAAGLRSAFSTSCKFLHAGFAASKGLFAANMAARGFSGPLDTLDRPDGFVALYADDIERANAAQRLEHWYVRDIVFKYHASCYGTQAPIDAALGLAARVSTDQIERIVVELEPQYVSVCSIASPRTASEGRFSVAHMVALALLGHDTAGETGFSPSMLSDSVVTDIRNKVQVRANDTLSRACARVIVTAKDGQISEQHADASQPEPDLRVQESRLIGKVAGLLSGQYPKVTINTLQQKIFEFESEKDGAIWAEELSLMLAAA